MSGAAMIRHSAHQAAGGSGLTFIARFVDGQVTVMTVFSSFKKLCAASVWHSTLIGSA